MRTVLKRLIAQQVRGVFNDRATGERPVLRHGDGLFGPGSVTWRVHGDVTTMMVGGITALLMQMLHPAVLAGVWDHSNFRADMHGRLRRTARFIAVTTYGSRTEAEASIARVRAVHARVSGTMRDGRPYSATDSELLAWVHATETLSFLASWMRYGDPAMSRADQDRYFAETAQVARGLGADPVPTTRAAMLDQVARTRAQLRADDRTREVARLVLTPTAPGLHAVPFEFVKQAAVDLLPPWARRMHGFGGLGVSRPLVEGGTAALARTVRWALG
ncbi:MAG: oxygenase MpaB family protein [Pseudomonadota bacterium]